MPSKAAIIATSAAVAVLLVGGGVAIAIALSGGEPGQARSILTARGEFVLGTNFHFGTAAGSCYADAQHHPEIKANATVTIRDEVGKIVGAGPLASGTVSPGNDHCEFLYRIESVPAGAKFYTVTVGASTPVTVSSDAMFSGAFVNLD